MTSRDVMLRRISRPHRGPMPRALWWSYRFMVLAEALVWVRFCSQLTFETINRGTSGTEHYTPNPNLAPHTRSLSPAPYTPNPNPPTARLGARGCGRARQTLRRHLPRRNLRLFMRREPGTRLQPIVRLRRFCSPQILGVTRTNLYCIRL